MSEKQVMMVEGGEALGAVVYWRLGTEPLDLDALEAELDERGLDVEEWGPGATSPGRALRSALAEVARERRMVRRHLGRGVWALVRVERKRRDPATPEGPAPATASEVDAGDSGERRLAADAELAAADMEAGVELKARIVEERDGAARLRVTPARGELAEAVIGAWAKWLAGLAPGQAARWLRRCVEKLDAVSLRETGGVYYVPRAGLATLDALAAAVEAAGGTLYRLPAVRAEEAVEAVLDALREEAEAAADAILGEVAGGELGERALETREARAEALLAKVARYEAALGTRLDDLRERLRDLKAAVAAARLGASSGEGDGGGDALEAFEVEGL